MCSAGTMKRLAEDLDVGFYSNKVSLTFPARRWLLILVAFLQAADGTARPVDIYQLIWMRTMAFYKEKQLWMSHHGTQSPVSTCNTRACYCLKQTQVNLSRQRAMVSALQISVIKAFLKPRYNWISLTWKKWYTVHCSNVIGLRSVSNKALDSSHELCGTWVTSSWLKALKMQHDMTAEADLIALMWFWKWQCK